MKCFQCGKQMPNSRRRDAKFCDAKCKNDFNNEMKRNAEALGLRPKRIRPHAVVACKVCGKSFKQERTTNVYCSPVCRNSGRNKIDDLI